MTSSPQEGVNERRHVMTSSPQEGVNERRHVMTSSPQEGVLCDYRMIIFFKIDWRYSKLMRYLPAKTCLVRTALKYRDDAPDIWDQKYTQI
jgi:hypothetical protein